MLLNRMAEGEPFLVDYDWDRINETREQIQVLVYGKSALSVQMEGLIVEGEAVLAEINAAQH